MPGKARLVSDILENGNPTKWGISENFEGTNPEKAWATHMPDKTPPSDSHSTNASTESSGQFNFPQTGKTLHLEPVANRTWKN
jgi:hypothetical protein|eukprot:CAMPEP_0174322862 /NCGR_PEP_ID=MMETSP0810-20121108/11339_1 /TAXON_ID=73025 ORGANISM="Eutreptiella gymnastica-like, Strain CCMP1594" /NCGR_SAMPLE_ID=MMETSP0810 /ASSEMBLY_ACC=CAM_ASM_000659 /LENGTH=82 /DNA_ID=CAMNT_0015434929 /DNA_START=25 /DNA_END=273 /DNA_ORIENTATION=-